VTKAAAIERANRWVRARYQVLPPVAGVLDFRPAALARAERLLGQPFPPEEVARFRGRWCVMYWCSWGTDAAGLPLRLGVLVDDQTGAAEPFDPSRRTRRCTGPRRQ
jgi:hypothetical protein